jgi:hypothetical protein
MKILRWGFIVLTFVGVAMAYFESDSGSAFDVLPFPAAGLSVRLRATVKDAGEYHLVVAMPVTNSDLSTGLSDDTQACSLNVRIAQDYNGPIVATLEVTSIRLEYEFGFGKTQSYEGGSWHLKPGVYDVDILGRKTCQAAVSRGATISLEEEIIEPTKTFLWDSCGTSAVLVSSGLGLLGFRCVNSKGVGYNADGESVKSEDRQWGRRPGSLFKTSTVR